MKLSIITVCYNAESTISDCLESVKNQTYQNVEHIVIDGASTDGTVKLVEKYTDSITVFISEPDHGIYDAMNKGLSLATGDIVGFLNADDFYASDAVLELIAGSFQDSHADVVYGDLCYVKREQPTEIVRYWKSSQYQPGKFETGWVPPHPTFFAYRSIYETAGGYYDTDFKLAADFELIIRYLSVNKFRSHYIPNLLVYMRLGGETNHSIVNILNQNREILNAFKKHGFEISAARFILGKFVSRAKQFLSRPSA